MLDIYTTTTTNEYYRILKAVLMYSTAVLHVSQVMLTEVDLLLLTVFIIISITEHQTNLKK